MHQLAYRTLAYNIFIISLKLFPYFIGEIECFYYSVDMNSDVVSVIASFHSYKCYFRPSSSDNATENYIRKAIVEQICVKR